MIALLLPLMLCFQSDPSATFQVKRYPLTLTPTKQTLILESNQEDVVFDLIYQTSAQTENRVKATLIGPGMAGPYFVDVAAGEGRIRLPRHLFSELGTYHLRDVRLERNGKVLSYSSPREAEILVIDELLVTRVQVRELDREELRTLGYVFNEDDYRTVKFTLALVMGSEETTIDVPVALPKVLKSTFAPVVLEDPFSPSVHIFHDPNPLLKDKLEGSNEGPTKELESPYTVFSLLLIPGDITYLKSHLKVTAVVANVSPDGIEARVTNLKAKLTLPEPTAYGIPLTTDEDSIKRVFNPGEDGVEGTEDDLNSLGPNQEGRVSFVLTGELEGIYPVETEITGQLELDGRTLTVNSHGRGRVMVRNPEYTVVMEHPDTVAQDEPYQVTMTIVNKGNQAIQDLSVTLAEQLMIGTRLNNDQALKVFGDIEAGSEGSVTWNMRSTITGEVAASFFKTEEGGSSLIFTTSVGDSGESLSHYSLRFPIEFVDLFGADLTNGIRRYLKKTIDFGLMSRDELAAVSPELSPPSEVAQKKLQESITLTARGVSYGLSKSEALLLLLSTYMRGGSDHEILDAVRRHISATSDLELERLLGEAISLETSSLSDSQLITKLNHVAASTPRLSLFLVNGADPVNISIVTQDGLSSSLLEKHYGIPFSGFLRLSANRTLVWCSANEVPQLKIQAAEPTTAQVQLITPGKNGRRRLSDLTVYVEGATSLFYQANLQEWWLQESSGNLLKYVTVGLEAEPFQVRSVRQMDPSIYGLADHWGRDLMITFNRPVDLASLDPIGEHLFINGLPVVSAESQGDGRFVLVSARTPLGPYREVSWQLTGAKDRTGQLNSVDSGTVQTSSYFAGVTVSGRVVDHRGGQLEGSRVFLFQQPSVRQGDVSRFDSVNNPRGRHFGSGNGFLVYQELTLDESGVWSLDFVPIQHGNYNSAVGPSFKIGVLLPDGRYKEQLFSPRGVGHEVIADFAFLFAGDVRGRITLEDGSPASFVPVYLVNEKNVQSAALAETDLNGNYYIRGIDVGPVTVKARFGDHIGIAGGYLTFADSPITVDLQIIEPKAAVSGKIAMIDPETGAQIPIGGAFVGLVVDETYVLHEDENSYNLPYSAGIRTADDGTFRIENITTGSATFFVYHPSFSYHRHNIQLLEGENPDINHFYLNEDFEGGSISGVVVDAQDVPVAGAKVVMDYLAKTTDSQGRFQFDSVPLNRDIRLKASRGSAVGVTNVYLDNSQPHLDQVRIGIYEPAVFTGTLTDAHGNPRAFYPISVIYEDERVDERFKTRNLKGVGNAEKKSESSPSTYSTVRAYTNESGYWSYTDPHTQDHERGFAGLNRPRISYVGAVPVVPGGRQQVHLVEWAVNDINVQLTDAAGNPVVGQVIFTVPRFNPTKGVYGTPYFASVMKNTDNQGVASIQANAGPLTVYGEHPLLGKTAVKDIDDWDGQLPLNLSLAFPSDELAGLFGSVYMPDGITPAPPETLIFAEIASRVGEGPSAIEATLNVDQNGFYQFSDLVSTTEPRRVRLVFYEPESGAFETMTFSMHQGLSFRKDVILNGSGSVTVGVVHADGTPAEAALVTLNYWETYMENGASGDHPARRQAGGSRQVLAGSPEVRFDNVPGGALLIHAEGPNGLVGVRSYAMPREGADLQLNVVLEASSDLSGTFINHDGDAIINGEVQLRAKNQDILQQLLSGEQTGEEGRFAFNRIPMREYILHGEDPASGFTAVRRVLTTPFAPQVDVQLQLDPILDLEGVVYENGEELAGATVSIQDQNGLILYTGSDSEGHYRFHNLREGRYTLSASKRGTNAVAAQMVVLEDIGATQQQDLIFAPTHQMNLRLELPNGNALPYTQITLTSEKYGYHRVYTDENGRIQVIGLPEDRYEVAVKDPRIDAESRAHISITSQDPEITERTLQFRGWSTVAGRVVNSLGESLSSPVHVKFTYYAGGSRPVVRTITSDALGTFRIGNLPADTHMSFEAVDPNTFESGKGVIISPAHGETLALNLTFKAHTTVSGMVVNHLGNPVPRARVRIENPIGRETYADDAGLFTLDPVPEGEILFKTYDPESPRRGRQTLTVAADTNGILQPITDLTLQISGLQSIRGTVRLADGTAISSGYVYLNQEGEPTTKIAILSDGSYSLKNLPFGEYSAQAYNLTLSKMGPLQTFTLDQDGLTEEIDLFFENDYLLSGLVTDPDGVPLEDALVELWRMDDGVDHRVYSDTGSHQGYYTLEHVYPGSYRIEAFSADRVLVLYREITIGEADQIEDLSLEQEASMLGLLEFADGRPVAAGSLVLDQFGKRTFLDLDNSGSFALSGLKPGPFTLHYSNGRFLNDAYNGVFAPGVNTLTFSLEPAWDLTGTAVLMSAEDTNLMIFATLGGRTHAYKVQPDGSFHVPELPEGQPFRLMVSGRNSRQTFDMEPLSADREIVEPIYLDATPPDLEFVAEGLDINQLPWQPVFTCGDPESSLKTEKTRVYINGHNVTDLFTITSSQITASFEFFPSYLKRGLNTLRVLVVNGAENVVVKEWDVTVNPEGTAVRVFTNYESAGYPTQVAIGDSGWVAFDSGGYAVITEVPAGTYNLKALNGDVGARKIVTISDATLTADITVNLYQHAGYRGQVTDPSGVPVAGARIEIDDFWEYSDENGNYRFDLIRIDNIHYYPRGMNVQGGSFLAFHPLVRLTSPGQILLGTDIQLQGEGHIEGFLKDESGVVYPGRTLTLTFDNPYGTAFGSRTAVTDASGFYRFQNVITYPVTLTATDPDTSRITRVGGRPEWEQTLTLDLVLENAGLVEGRLLNDMAMPVAGAEVSIDDARTYSDEDGYFQLTGVRRKNYLDFLVLSEEHNKFYQSQLTLVHTDHLDLGDLILKNNKVPIHEIIDIPTEIDPDQALTLYLRASDDLALAYSTLQLEGLATQTVLLDHGQGPLTVRNITVLAPGSVAEGILHWTLTTYDLLGRSTTDSGDVVFVEESDGPMVTVLEPAANHPLVEGEPFQLRVTADDPTGVDRVELYLEQTLIGNLIKSGGEYHIALAAPSSAVSPEILLEIRAYDQEGNRTTVLHPIQLIEAVDTEAPVVSAVTPLDGMPQPLFLEDGLQLHLVADLQDDVGLDSYRWRIDGVDLIEHTVLGTQSRIDDVLVLPAAFRQAEQILVELTVTDVGENQTVYQANIHNLDGQVVTGSLQLSAGDTTYDGSSLILNGGDHIIDGAHHFTSLALVNGARLGQSATTGDESWVASTSLKVEQDLVVNRDSAMEMNGVGYIYAPLLLPELSLSSHGGLGFSVTEPNAHVVYGSIFKPALPGSKRGGGALRAEAQNFWLDGQISALPLETNNNGSGGSIWLSADSFHGFGEVRADGFENEPTHGKGGGGRIAIYGEFQGRVSASGAKYSGAGTIYRAEPDQTLADGNFDQIELAGADINGAFGFTVLKGLENITFGDAFLVETEVVEGISTEVLTIQAGIYQGMQNYVGMRLYKEGDWENGVTLESQSQHRLVPAAGSDFSAFQPGDLVHIGFRVDQLVLGENAYFLMQPEAEIQPMSLEGGTLTSDIPRDLTGRLTISHGYLKGDYSLDPLHLEQGTLVLNGTIQLPSLVVGADAVIDTADEHFARIRIEAPQILVDGQIRGNAAGDSVESYYSGNNGGIYMSTIGTTRGSFYRPLTGGNGNNAGGHIHLIFDQLTLNGQLNVDGSGGSGGTLLLEGQTLLGGGLLSANGSLGGSGAGRITVLDADINGFSGSMNAYGRTMSASGQPGGAGTVFIRNAETPNGRLIIDNHGGRNDGQKVTTPLPGLGIRTAGGPTGGSVIQGSDFADSLVGLYLDVDGFEPVRIGASSATELHPENGNLFPELTAGQSYGAFHRLDILEVRGNAVLSALDPIILSQPAIVTDGGSLGDTDVRTPGGAVTFDDGGNHVLSDDGISEVTVSGGTHLTIERSLHLENLFLNNATVLITAPITVDQMVIDGGTVIAQVDGSIDHLNAGNVTLLNGAVWTIADRKVDQTDWPFNATVTGTLSVDAGSVIQATGSTKVLATIPRWAGQALSVVGHGGYAPLSSGQEQPGYGSFAYPRTSGPNHGGGRIRLNVGNLELDGALDVQGVSGPGGSILIYADTISGTGRVDARGSLAGNSQKAGGRIAVYYGQDADFLNTIQFQLFHPQLIYRDIQLSGAGTLFLRKKDAPLGDLIIDQQASVGGNAKNAHTRQRLTYISGPSAITLNLDDENSDPRVVRDRSRSDLPPGLAGLHALFTVDGVDYNLEVVDNTPDTLIFAEDGPAVIPAQTEIRFVLALNRLLLRDGAQLYFEGLVEPQSVELEGEGLNSIWAENLNVAGQVGPWTLNNSMLRLILEQPELAQTSMVLNGSVLWIDKPLSLDTVELYNGSSLSHTPYKDNVASFLPNLELTANRLAADNTSGLLLADKSDIANPVYYGNNQEYGGFTGKGNTYGNLFRPNDFGPTNGAGRAHLILGELAGGYHSADDDNAAGSLWIEAGTVSGDIRLSADGTGTISGGGRVALYYGTDQTQSLTVSALSRRGNPHGPGTVYLKAESEAYGHLILDNQSGDDVVATPIPAWQPFVLGNAGDITYDGALNQTRFKPNMDLVLVNAVGDTYLQDFSGYHMVRNQNPGEAWRILETQVENGEIFWVIEGDARVLAADDSLSPALKLDRLTLGENAGIAPAHLMLLDDIAPTLIHYSWDPDSGGPFLPGQSYQLTVSAKDNVGLSEVRADVDGINLNILSQDGNGIAQTFQWQTPSPDQPQTAVLTITITDKTGHITQNQAALDILEIDLIAPRFVDVQPTVGTTIESGTSFDTLHQVSDNRELAQLSVSFAGLQQDFLFNGGSGESSVPFTWNAPFVNQDTIYTLAATLTDLAGNTSTHEVEITVTAASGLIPKPVAYWTMDDADKVNYKTGDKRGYHHAVVDSTSAYTTGQVNQARSFSGSGYIDVGNEESLTLTTAFSFAAWIKLRSTTREDQGLFVQGTDQTTLWSLLAHDGQHISLNMGGERLSSDPLDTNWHHVAAVFDQGSVQLFIDGQLAQQGVFATTMLPQLADMKTMLGWNFPNNGSKYFGYMDEVLLWNQAVNAATVDAVYQNGVNRIINNQDPTDFVPGADITNLSFVPGQDHIQLSWTAPSPQTDLDALLVYLDEEEEPMVLLPSSDGVQLSDLNALQTVSVRIASRDLSGNISKGLSRRITTFCDPNQIPRAVSYWSFDSSESNGRLALDVLGTNDFFYSTGNSGQAGVVQKAHSLSNTFMETPPSDGFQFNGSFSLGVWLRPIAFGDQTAVFFGNENQAIFQLDLAGNSSDSYHLRYSDNAGNTMRTPVADALKGSTWYHIGVVFGQGEARLFLDGEEVDRIETGSSPQDVVDPYLTIGFNPTNQSKGRTYVDEMTVWSTAISNELMHLLYQQGSLGLGLHGLPFDFKPAEPVSDLSAYGTEDGVNLSWTGSANSQGDLSAYLLYLEGESDPIQIPASAVSYQLDLAPLTRVAFELATLDSHGNEGRKVSGFGVSLPNAPADFPRARAYWTMDSADINNHLPRDVAGEHHAFFRENSMNTTNTNLGQAGYLYNNRIQMDGHEDFESADFTLALWIRSISFNHEGGIIQYGNESQARFTLAQISDGRYGYGFQMGGAQVQTPITVDKYNQMSGSLSTSLYNHLVVVSENGELVLYLDGVEVDRQSFTAPLPELADAVLTWGEDPRTNLHGRGYLDEVIFFNQALDDAEAGLLFQRGRNGFSLYENDLDLRPAKDVENFTVVPAPNQLSLQWDQANGPHNDAEVLLLYVDDAEPIEIAASESAFVVSNLVPGQVYVLRLATRDQAGNISVGRTLDAATLPVAGLPEPTAYWSMNTGTAGSDYVLDVMGVTDSETAALYAGQNGRVEKAIRFGSASHQVTMLRNSDLDFTDQFTLFLWMISSNVNDNGGILTYASDTNGAFTLTTAVDADGTWYPVFTVNPLLDPESTALKALARNGLVKSAMNSNSWYHLALTYDAGRLKIRRNGVLMWDQQLNAAQLPFIDGAKLRLGRNDLAAGELYPGNLDELALWDRALSDAELLAYYHRNVAGHALYEDTGSAKSLDLQSSESFEDHAHLVLVDEDLWLHDLNTDKEIWLINTRLRIDGSLHGRDIHLLENSELVIGDGPVVIWADDLLTVDESSVVRQIQGGIRAPESALDVAETGVVTEVRAQRMTLNGKIKIFVTGLNLHFALLDGTGLIHGENADLGIRFYGSQTEAFTGRIISPAGVSHIVED